MYVKLAKINGIEDVDRFLYPDRNEMHSPWLLKNMAEAVNKIDEAITNGKMITIYLDVDADGVNSGAVMYRYLKNFTDNVQYFHAQRSQGHGLKPVIDKIPENTELLIIVDSSSNDTKYCKQIVEDMNIDIVIIDHHEIEEDNPYCILVNPQQKDCQYPNKEISGAGVTWKVCCALDRHYNEDFASELIDLATVGIIGDMMSMKELENRAIISQGLIRVKNKGIYTILSKKGKNLTDLTAKDIAYDVVPLLNAAARMDRIELAVQMLISDDPNEVLQLHKEISSLNAKRKSTQSIHIDKFKEMVNEDDKIIIIVDNQVGKSFAGLIANDLAQKYKRPCIVLGIDKDGNYAGSFRSYGNFLLKDYLSSLKEVESAAGHQSAGGVNIKKHSFDEFVKSANGGLKDVEFDQSIEYDLSLDANEINEDLIRRLKNFYRISGKGFEEGKFLIKNLFVSDKNLIGSNKDTVKIDCDPLVLMKFKVDQDYFDGVPIFSEIEAIGTLNINEWKVFRPKFKIHKTNQLFIEDYRVLN